VLAAVGEHDIVGPAGELAGYFPASPDVEVQVLPGAYHNSKVAPDRQLLWDKLARWARTVPRPPAERLNRPWGRVERGPAVG
jgi:alpha-beta hydrolase superfamily lysophospholipase